MGYISNEARSLRCTEVHTNEPRQPMEGVSKDRRKVLLSDTHNSIVVYVICCCCKEVTKTYQDSTEISNNKKRIRDCANSIPEEENATLLETYKMIVISPSIFLRMGLEGDIHWLLGGT